MTRPTRTTTGTATTTFKVTYGPWPERGTPPNGVRRLLPYRWWIYPPHMRFDRMCDFDRWTATGMRFLGRDWFVRKVASS